MYFISGIIAPITVYSYFIFLFFSIVLQHLEPKRSDCVKPQKVKERGGKEQRSHQTVTQTTFPLNLGRLDRGKFTHFVM